MKTRIIVTLAILFSIFFQSFALAATTPQEIIEKVKTNFLKIKDAAADYTLDYNIRLFGCTGLTRIKGQGYYKAPDRIKTVLNKNTTYFARRNSIKKIDGKGKKYYVKLLNSLDFGVGFHPGLIDHNFDLTIIEDSPDHVILLGLPKADVLKNVKKVFFYIDTKEYLLRELNIIFVNEKLPGKITIDYEKIDGLWVPVGLQGKSAIELVGGILAGMDIRLKGENIQINKGLSDQLFNPGF